MKNQNLMARIFLILLWALIWGGCVGQTGQSQDQPLEPRAGANPDAMALIQEGNRFFEKRDYREAVKNYEAAIHAQSSLGEAHYNLGLALSKRRLYSEARPHFEKAVELEPFNPIIQNAPPFRKYEPDVPTAPEPASDGHFGHQH